MQAGRLRKQSSERGGQAASRCGQEQLHGEVYEERLEHLAAVQRRHLSVPALITGPVLQAARRSELLGSLS